MISYLSALAVGSVIGLFFWEFTWKVVIAQLSILFVFVGVLPILGVLYGDRSYEFVESTVTVADREITVIEKIEYLDDPWVLRDKVRIDTETISLVEVE